MLNTKVNYKDFIDLTKSNNIVSFKNKIENIKNKKTSVSNLMNAKNNKTYKNDNINLSNNNKKSKDVELIYLDSNENSEYSEPLNPNFESSIFIKGNSSKNNNGSH